MQKHRTLTILTIVMMLGALFLSGCQQAEYKSISLFINSREIVLDAKQAEKAWKLHEAVNNCSKVKLVQQTGNFETGMKTVFKDGEETISFSGLIVRIRDREKVYSFYQLDEKEYLEKVYPAAAETFDQVCPLLFQVISSTSQSVTVSEKEQQEVWSDYIGPVADAIITAGFEGSEITEYKGDQKTLMTIEYSDGFRKTEIVIVEDGLIIDNRKIPADGVWLAEEYAISDELTAGRYLMMLNGQTLNKNGESYGEILLDEDGTGTMRIFEEVVSLRYDNDSRKITLLYQESEDGVQRINYHDGKLKISGIGGYTTFIRTDD